MIDPELLGAATDAALTTTEAVGGAEVVGEGSTASPLAYILGTRRADAVSGAQLYLVVIFVLIVYEGILHTCKQEVIWLLQLCKVLKKVDHEVIDELPDYFEVLPLEKLTALKEEPHALGSLQDESVIKQKVAVQTTLQQP